MPGETFTYYKRYYTLEICQMATYAGGIRDHANWMSLADIERALHLAGFRVKRMVEDSFEGVPAMNIWASKD